MGATERAFEKELMQYKQHIIAGDSPQTFGYVAERRWVYIYLIYPSSCVSFLKEFTFRLSAPPNQELCAVKQTDKHYSCLPSLFNHSIQETLQFHNSFVF